VQNRGAVAHRIWSSKPIELLKKLAAIIARSAINLPM
jgi:hypothetical protein